MRFAVRRGVAAAVAAILTGRSGAQAAILSDPSFRGSLLVRHARLVDGTGSGPREDVAISVIDGRIAAIGADGDVAAAAGERGTPEIDARGATVIAGLVDAHVHLSSVLGAEVRGDSPARLDELRRRQLRSYLACGVTTVLDTAIPLDVLFRLRAWLAEGEAGPSFLTLGPPIPPAGGYMSSGYPELAVRRPEDLDRNFAAADAAGAFGVKVPIERGFGADILPIHEPAVRRAITDRAAARGLPILVHASDEEEQTIGLEMGAYALLHLNFAGRDPSPGFVDRLAASKAYAVTTFSILDAELVRAEPSRLDDPLVRIAVPAPELDTARDPEAWIEAEAMNLRFAFPWMPAFARRFFARRNDHEAGLRRALAVNLRAARTLHERGIPIAIGSDAGNFVVAQFHGTSTLRETQLLAEAGLPPAAVLAAATSVPARMLRLEDEIGTVEVGKRADFVVVSGDPLADVAALRAVRWTVKSGVAHVPSEWVEERAP